MDSPRYKSTIGFIDLLFNILLGFAFLFIIAFLLIKPEQKKADFERKAEFVIVMEWDHDQPDDIDLYVQDPTQNKVHFRLPIINFMYLDKDDLGFANDVVKNVDGTITKVNINREVVTIRGIIPGEYIVNAHYYSSREWTRHGQVRTNITELNSEQVKDKKNPLTIKIELHKVNPYKILWVGEKKFIRKGQENTFVRFTVDKDGEIIGDFTYEEKLFVIPFSTGMIQAPDIIEDEPNGASILSTAPEESHYSERDSGDPTRGF